MKIAVLGGAGLMGSGTVRDLMSNESKGVEKVIVADLSVNKAKELADVLGDGRVEAVALDVTDKQKMADLLKDSDICINAVPTFSGHQMDIFHACLDAGCHYVDYGGMGIYTVKQKEEHRAWEDAGLAAVIGLGADPGMSNVLCKAVAEELDTVDSINLYWAAKLEGPENPVLVPPYSIATLLAEFAHSSKQFMGGKLVEMPPQSGKETLLLPEPFGETEFMHTQHSEPLTVPFSKGIKDKGIREFTWKLHLPERENEVYKALIKVGFGDFDDPLEIDGARIKPVDYLHRLIQRNIERNRDKIPDQQSYEIHMAVGKGKKNKLATTATCTVTSSPDPFFDDYNDAATSMNASIGAQLIMRNGLIPGVWGPEEYYDVNEYFAELTKRKFKITMKVESERSL